MRYGLYTEDLKGVSLSDVSLETARKYLREGKVICSQRYKTYGFGVGIRWYGEWRFRFRRYGVWIGPVGIVWERVRYLACDKVIEKYEPEKIEEGK